MPTPSQLSCLALLTGLFAPVGSAQVRQSARPISERISLPREVPTATLPRPDIESLAREDLQRGFGPFRYGAVIETDQGLEHTGRWDRVPAEGAFVWRLRISSPGAHSLGIVFGEYDIPAGGQVFLYDDGGTHVLGAYTEANSKSNGMLAIEPVAGDALTIEYVQAAWVSQTPRLRVRQVVHDYRDLFHSDFWRSGSNQSGQCFVDVNCPEGAPYQDIKRSVVRALSGGMGCSASILNNTANDGTPYMLTANHCGSFTNAVVVFNFELPGCGSGVAPTSQTVSGATLLANNSLYDSQLYLLSSAPPASYNPYYAGWYRVSSLPPPPGVSISHPQSLPKKIAIDDSGAVLSGQYWRVSWDVGMVHGGSSGSPLFNGLGQVLGPACCVTNFICGSQTTLYGRFDGFWNNENIVQYLDPLGTGAVAIGGHDPCPPLSSYCTAKLNSCAGTPAVSASGLSSASASSGFTLSASGAQTGKAGLVLYTSGGARIPAAPFQGGLLCIASPLRRSAVITASGGTPGNCDASFDLDWNAFASGNAGGNPAGFLTTAGQRVDLQVWGRDTVQHGSFLSEALSYLVCP